MFSFIINFDNSIDNLGCTSSFLYPFLKDTRRENQIRILLNNKEKNLEDVANEIRLFIQDEEIREWQAIFIVSLFDITKSNKIDEENYQNYFEGSLANQINNIKVGFIEEMAKHRLNVNNIIVIVVDDIEKDKHGIPKNYISRTALELDKFGYVKTQDFSEDELNEIEEFWESSWHNEQININEIIENELVKNNNVIVKKIFKVYQESAQKVKMIIENKKTIISERFRKELEFSQYNDINILDDIYYEFENKFKRVIANNATKIKLYVGNYKKEKISNLLKDVLSAKNYNFNYVFNEKHIEIVDEIWGKGFDLNNENLTDPSLKVIQDIDKRFTEIKDKIKQITDYQIENINHIKKTKYNNTESNVFLNEEVIAKIRDEFLKEVQRIKTTFSKDITHLNKYQPSSTLKEVLERNIGMKTLNGGEFFIFKVCIEKKPEINFKEGLVKLVYLLIFILENNQEHHLNRLQKGKIYLIDDIVLNHKWIKNLKDEYCNSLKKIKTNLERKQKEIKNRDVFKLVLKEESTFVKDNEIKKIYSEEDHLLVLLPENRKLTHYSKDWDVSIWEEWIEKINKNINEYKSSYQEKIEEYRSILKSLGTRDDSKGVNIEDECDKRENDLKEKQKYLLECNVAWDIENNFNKKIEKSTACKRIFETKLYKRPTKEIVIISVLMGIGIMFFTHGLAVIDFSRNFTGYILPLITIIFVSLVAKKISLINIYEEIRRVISETKRLYHETCSEIKDCFLIQADYIKRRREVEISKLNFIEAEKEKTRYIKENNLIVYHIDKVQKNIKDFEIFVEIARQIEERNHNGNEEYSEGSKEDFVSKEIENLEIEKAEEYNDIYIPSLYSNSSEDWSLNIKIGTEQKVINSRYMLGCKKIVIKSEEKGS